MNPSRVKMLEEQDGHFVMHDGRSEFKVPKSGLSEDMHEKIRAMAPKKMAVGGGVLDPYLPEPVIPPTMSSIPPVSEYEQGEADKLAALRAGGGFDEAAYTKATQGQLPQRGPEQYKEKQLRIADVDKQLEHKAASEAAGIKLRSGAATSAENTTKTAPEVITKVAPATRTPMPGMSSEGPDEFAAANKAAEAAAKAKYEAEATVARNAAALEMERVKQIQAHAAEQEEAHQRSSAATAAMMTKVQDANDEMGRIDTSVDPGRFWATRSTGQKIAGIIGLALGALGAGPDGVNRAAAMMNQAIDRDIDAQKSEHELRLKKGNAGIATATTMYGLHHQALQDDIAAMSASKASGDELAAAKARQVAAATADPVLKANLMQVNAGLMNDAAVNREKTRQRLFDNNQKRAMLGLEERKLEMERAGRGSGGTGPKTAEHLAEIETRNNLIQSNADELIGLIRKHGTTGSMAPGVKLRMNQLTGALAVDNVKLADANSIVSPGEKKAAAEDIFEPGFWQRESSVEAQIQSVKDLANKRRNADRAARGIAE